MAEAEAEAASLSGTPLSSPTIFPRYICLDHILVIPVVGFQLKRYDFIALLSLSSTALRRGGRK